MNKYTCEISGDIKDKLEIFDQTVKMNTDMAFLVGVASVLMEDYRKISSQEIQDKIKCWFQDIQKVFCDNRSSGENEKRER